MQIHIEMPAFRLQVRQLTGARGQNRRGVAYVWPLKLVNRLETFSRRKLENYIGAQHDLMSIYANDQAKCVRHSPSALL